MKSRVLLSVLIIFLTLAVVSCHPEILSCDIVIESWGQNYSEYSGEWSDLVVFYKITNTGNVRIFFYQIWFKAYCKDGSSYEDWIKSLWLYVGQSKTDYTFINIPDKEVVSVEVTDWDLMIWINPSIPM
ncbi:hypothetical protein CVT91_09670 [Candidatus Atribacteria bacterium HGW-Atribacteria-1]|nr:MAG: hypothetical protein CVT91_09670 [Candidatus Atribacteria bacterium HGW-Atribacteria-1]